MGFIFSLLLIALGLLGAKDLIIGKLPASRNFLDKLNHYKEPIGLAGLLIGLVSLAAWILVLRYTITTPFQIILAIVTTIVLVGLGIIFSMDLIRSQLKDPNTKFLTKLEGFRLQLAAYQQIMGLAAIVLGILHLPI